MGEAYDHIQRAYGEYYASAQTVPANTVADGDDGAQENSGAMGGIEVVAVAKTDVVMAASKNLQVWLEHRSDPTYSYAVLGTVANKTTGAGTTTYSAGDVLGRFVIPSDCLKYTKAVLYTNDAAAIGTIDVFPAMLPR